jgi:myosin heavy subunit
MKTKFKNEKLIITGSLVFLFLSLASVGFYYTSNKSLAKNLNNEKLRSEMILSEKVSLDKEILNFKNQLSALKGTNNELDQVIAQISQKLKEKETELSNIKRENGSIKSLKKQLDEISKLNKDLDGQVASLNESVKKLNSEKETLNETIASLKAENQELAENNKIMSSLKADNYLVQTTRGKNKLTVKARRTNKIAVSLKVPANMIENLQFTIIKPNGMKVKGNDKGMAVRTIDDDDQLMVSIYNDEIKVSKNIEFSYTPKEKLKPGTYKIEMYNGEKYIGSCNVKLR